MIRIQFPISMGEIADSMIRGEFCAICGVYLEPGEKVYVQGTDKVVKMPKDGSGYGIPVECESCHDD